MVAKNKGKNGRKRPQNTSLKLKDVEPMTDNQRRVFESYDKEQNLVLHGSAGTGKSFLALYLSLADILEYDKSKKKVIIVRSIVPTRDIGFLPGSLEEKQEVYETPYKHLCNELFKRGEAYSILKSKRMIEFMSTSYVRGITLDNCIVIVDEIQNMSDMELHSIITRVGNNCRIIFCGDYYQKDYMKETSGWGNFFQITKELETFDLIYFGSDDIVRSEFVKIYIKTRDRLIKSGKIVL